MQLHKLSLLAQLCCLLQLLEEDGEDGKERRTLRSRLELPVQVCGTKSVKTCSQINKKTLYLP